LKIGGKVDLLSIFKDKYHRYTPCLRKRSLMYLDQLTTPDGKYLLQWRIFMKRLFTNARSQGHPTIWYKELISLLTVDTSLLLASQYSTSPTLLHKGFMVQIP